VCGLEESESVKVKVPVRVPTAVGVNFTLWMQLAPAARLCPQLPALLKSPLIVMLVIDNAVVLLFVRVTFCAELVIPTVTEPKFRLVGETVTPPLPAPVPLRLTVCGLEASESVKVKVPVRRPTAVGVNFTFIVQLAPGP